MANEQKHPEVRKLVESRPEENLLQGVGRLARSFVDSIIKSDAVLLMTPQQQALCAVCHALQKHGMAPQTVLQRYAALACEDEAKQQAVLASMQVCMLRHHCR